MSFSDDNKPVRTYGKDGKGRDYQEYGDVRTTTVYREERMFRTRKDGTLSRVTQSEVQKGDQVVIITSAAGVVLLWQRVTRKGIEP